MVTSNEFGWELRGTSYLLTKKYMDLGNGKQTTREVWELSMKIGNRWDAQWKQAGSNRSIGATRGEMRELLAEMFSISESKADIFLNAVDSSNDEETTPRRVASGAPKIEGGGLPTRQPVSRF